MVGMNPKVDAFFDKAEKWPKELEALRGIILDCGLTEELKWGQPCYSVNKRNILIIGELNKYCVLSFFKGSLLQDSSGLLIQPGEHTQTVRLIPFTSAGEIREREPVLRAYIYEAIEVEKAGVSVNLIKSTDLTYPEEFQRKLAEMPPLKAAFYALTPGRQRAYYLYFSQPKQAKTRASRVEKCIPQILDGIGLHD